MYLTFDPEKSSVYPRKSFRWPQSPASDVIHSTEFASVGLCENSLDYPPESCLRNCRFGLKPRMAASKPVIYVN